MSNNLIKIFENQSLGRVRVTVNNGQPWFCLKDICDILGIKNPGDLRKRLNQNGIDSIYTIDDMGRNQPTLFIDESNLYKTIFQSRKPIARQFEDWVTGEVLPSIRQTGYYFDVRTGVNADFILQIGNRMRELETENQNLTNSYNQLQESYEELEDENDSLYWENNEMKPKVEVYDIIVESPYGHDAATIAGVLHYGGVGRNKLLRILRDNKMLKWNNAPYQRYANQGYFSTIMNTCNDGKMRPQTLILGKAIPVIINLLDSLGYERIEDR